MGEGDEDKKLADATWNSLNIASEKGLSSIAFPAISTGIFGFPKERCAQIMLTTVVKMLREEETSLREVVFCLWGEDPLRIFQETAKKMLGP